MRTGLPNYFQTPKPAKKGKKRTKIKPMSKKRAVQLRTYSALRKDFLAKYPECCVCGVRPSEHVHHRAKRVGEKLNDVKD